MCFTPHELKRSSWRRYSLENCLWYANGKWLSYAFVPDLRNKWTVYMKPHKCWVVPAGFKTNLIRRYWVKNSSAFNFHFSSYWKSSMLGVLEEPGDNEFWHANSVCLSIFVNLMRKFKSSCKALSFLSRERWSPLILWDRIKGVDNHRFDGDQICTLLRMVA